MINNYTMWSQECHRIDAQCLKQGAILLRRKLFSLLQWAVGIHVEKNLLVTAH